MIRERIVKHAAVRDYSRAPVRGDRSAAQVFELRLSAFIAERSPPKRNSGKHGVLVDQARPADFVQSRLTPIAVRTWLGTSWLSLWTVSREGIKRAIGQPIGFFASWLCALCGGASFRCQLLVIELVGKLGNRSERFNPQTLHVDFFVRRIQRASFHPAVTKVGVFDQSVSIGVGRRCESIGFEYRFPVSLYELEIAAGSPVIPVSDNVQWRRIRACPGIAIVFEPGDQSCALRYLVWDLAIFSLVLLKEIKRSPRRLVVPIRRDRKRCP